MNPLMTNGPSDKLSVNLMEKRMEDMYIAIEWNLSADYNLITDETDDLGNPLEA